MKRGGLRGNHEFGKRKRPVDEAMRCDYPYCRGGVEGVTFTPEGQPRRRLCDKHYAKFCVECHGLKDMEAWLVRHERHYTPTKKKVDGGMKNES